MANRSSLWEAGEGNSNEVKPKFELFFFRAERLEGAKVSSTA